MKTLKDLINKVNEDPLLNERMLGRDLQIHINGAVYTVNEFDAVFRRDNNIMVLDISPGFHQHGQQGEPVEEEVEEPKLGDKKEVSEEEKGRMLDDDEIMAFIHKKRENIESKKNG